MPRFIAGRIVAGLVSLVLFVTIVFFLAEVLMPARQDPFEAPVWEQYLDYLREVFSGGFVESGAMDPLPWTLLIFVVAVGFAFPIGHWLGKVAGWKSGATGSAGLTIGAVLMYTVFPPLLVFALVMIVSRFTNDQGIGFLRTLFNEGGLDAGVAWSMLLTIVVVAAGCGLLAWLSRQSGKHVPPLAWALALLVVPLLVWAGRGMLGSVSDIVVYLGMPIIAVAILVVGEVILVSKSTTAEAAHEDFVFTAKAKGVADRDVRDHHVARFALLPMLSKLMVSVPFILVGLMIVELSFGWAKFGVECGDPSAGCLVDPAGNQLGALGYYVPGMSSTVFASLENRDTATVIDGLIVVGVVVLAIRLLLEVTHALLDPRIRVRGRGQ